MLSETMARVANALGDGTTGLLSGLWILLAALALELLPRLGDELEFRFKLFRPPPLPSRDLRETWAPLLLERAGGLIGWRNQLAHMYLTYSCRAWLRNNFSSKAWHAYLSLLNKAAADERVLNRERRLWQYMVPTRQNAAWLARRIICPTREELAELRLMDHMVVARHLKQARAAGAPDVDELKERLRENAERLRELKVRLPNRGKLIPPWEFRRVVGMHGLWAALTDGFPMLLLTERAAHAAMVAMPLFALFLVTGWLLVRAGASPVLVYGAMPFLLIAFLLRCHFIAQPFALSVRPYHLAGGELDG